MKRTALRSGRHILAGGFALGLLVATAQAQEVTLYSFTGGGDGGMPHCGLISGGKGVDPTTMQFFGTTETGGANGDGTVFQIDGAGSETVLHSFSGSDGALPMGCPMPDPKGNLYGTTSAGGKHSAGTVFRLKPGGGETVLYSFTGGSDGAYPYAGVVMDKAGNLYGTTYAGGANGLGVVFEVAPGGSESVLHSFAGSDGAFPVSGLVMDASGNLYGTTTQGGRKNRGTVFELAKAGSETVLHAFAGASDGANPFAGLIMDKSRNLFGTTADGGANNLGVVFKITATGKEKVLYAFAGGSGDGAEPLSGVIEKNGWLYGTTNSGGAGNAGTIFKTSAKSGGIAVLYSFSGGSDGASPQGGVLDAGGTLFGTTLSGGNPGCTSGCGVVFALTP